MERQAPRQVMYENQLPLAIESKSTRRLFFPEGGSEYGPTGNGSRPNIIRIPINADSLLDVQHSFLQFKLTNLSATANSGIVPDFGAPFIRRLRIESAGTTLEDIEEYGKLYGGVLFPAQASVGAVQDSSLTTAGIGDQAADLSDLTATATAAHAVFREPTVVGGGVGITAAESAAFAANAAGADAVNQKITAALTDIQTKATAQIDAALVKLNARTISGASALAGVKHGLASTIGPGGVVTYNIPLVSALMNMDKYLPLVMMNAGLTLEIELDVANSLGVSVTDARPAEAIGALVDANWKISDVRYVAHLIDLQRDFYDKMRMVMEGSGGVLQLAGSTFRHYAGTAAAASQELVVNIPSRVKSIKSVFFTQQLNTQKASSTHFGTSESIPNNISEYQFRIGSVVYPSTSVKVDGGAATSYTNKGEAYSELRKAFGTLGDYQEGGVLLNKDTYLAGVPSTKASSAYASNSAPLVPTFCPFGLDFEAFPKTALESGVNTADRSLPMTLEIKKHSGVGFAVNVDVWVMCDAIFYVNLDGSVSVSI